MTKTRVRATVGDVMGTILFGLVALGVACSAPTKEPDDGMAEARTQCDGYVGRYEACLNGTSSNSSLSATKVADLKASLDGAMGGDRNSRVALAKRCEREAHKLQRCAPAAQDRREVAP